MLFVGLFAATLLLGLILADWVRFGSLTAPARKYGYPLARREERLPVPVAGLRLHRFDGNGLLRLQHGVARLFMDELHILLRAQSHIRSFRFRTAWPLKATISLRADGSATRVDCVKRMPWSSACLTLLWFLLVGIGTVGFVVTFLLKGGFASLSGALMGIGIAALGFLVLAFGLVVVALAYRLEDHRLTQAYGELLSALTGGS
jgi:hypothetical protein